MVKKAKARGDRTTQRYVYVETAAALSEIKAWTGIASQDLLRPLVARIKEQVDASRKIEFPQRTIEQDVLEIVTRMVNVK